MADKKGPFDALPFRITQLLYALLGASLLIALYVRLGVPALPNRSAWGGEHHFWP
jgi:hypothetical protein